MPPADDPAQADDDLLQEDADVAVQDEGADEGEPAKLDLIVDIQNPSACERHVVVTVSRADIDRYFDDAYSGMMTEAQIPGFRAGKAPRALVEKRFKKEAGEQVKSSLLMDSLTQISSESEFAAISEPDLNLDAVEVPDTGPMTFEFDIEVRPEFDMPKWKGLKIERPVRDFTDEDVDDEVQKMLSRYGQLAPLDEPAEPGDFVTLNVTSRADGKELTKEEELVVRVRDTLSFADGRLDGFAELMTGVEPDTKKTAKVTLSQDAPNVELRGKEVDLEIKVLDVKRLKLPELTEDFLAELGNFETEDDFRSAVKQNLVRQLEYEQQQKSRQQITALLTESATWELPPGLLKRQSAREVERAVMELRRSGFSEAEIRARENELRQNSTESTTTALKEHFILERIAEEQEIDIEEGDYEKEIFLMSMQSGESPRRVRAQLEKRGLMDVLRNQIVERKVLELVQQEANFKDLPYEREQSDVEAVNVVIGGGRDSLIPEAVDEQAEEEASDSE
ncbi:MAG: trigger factor [Planctomycetota bacterium]